MLRTALRNLVAHRLRLLLTGLAVLIAVAFVSGTYVFTDSLRAAFDNLTATRSADVELEARQEFGAGSGQGLTRVLPQSLLPRVRAVDGVAVAVGEVSETGAVVIGADGEPLDSAGGPPPRGRSWVDVPALNPYSIVDGNPPAAADDVVLDDRSAERAGVGVGDTVRIVTPAGSGQYRVVGIASRGISGGGGSAAALFTLATAQQQMLEPDALTTILITAQPGVDQITLATRLTDEVGDQASVRTAADLNADAAQRLDERLGFLNTMLLAFALVALGVASFLIVNTFSILVAQRTRELALLRALGASRSQITTSVLAEALGVSVIASVLGLGVGIGLAAGIRAGLPALGLEVPAGQLVVAPRTLVLGLIVGIVVTLLAALLPSLRAGRIAPVAALRDDIALPARSLRRRALIGVALLIIAALTAYLGLQVRDDAERAARWVGGSAAAAVLGLIALSPSLARPFIRALAAPLAGRTVPRLARENARRNPRRTAATAGALTIGVALMSALTVIAASATASTDALVDNTIGADYVLFGTGFRPFTPAILASVQGTPGTDVVTAVRQVPVETPVDGRTALSGVDTSSVSRVLDLDVTAGSLDNLAFGSVVVDSDTAADNGWRLGDVVSITAVNGPTTVRISGLFTPAGPFQGLIASMPTLAAIGARELDQAVYITLAQDADAALVRADLEQRLDAYPSVTLQDQTEFKAQIRDQVNRVLGLVIALLFLAVLIAVLGIANTLLLSVAERTRELGLLRAVGTSRRQVRTMITIEAVLLGLFGAAVGVVLGLTYGVLLQRVLADEGISVLSIPTGQIVLFIALGAVGGIIAAVWPAIRAGRLDILRAIATD